MSNPEICVAGGGSWGTALAHLLAGNGYKTCLWLRDAAVAEAVRNRHENPRYLPGFALHPSLDATTDPAAMGREIVVLAVPCQQLRGWLAANAAFFRKNVVLVNAAKGIETTNLATCAEVTEQSLGHLLRTFCAVCLRPWFWLRRTKLWATCCDRYFPAALFAAIPAPM